MGKGSTRRPEDTEAVRRNWPFPPKERAPELPYLDTIFPPTSYGVRLNVMDAMMDSLIAREVAGTIGLTQDADVPRGEAHVRDIETGKLLGKIVNMGES